MTAAAAPSGAEQLARRLVTAADDAKRHSIIQRAGADAALLRETALLLCDEAARSMGNPPRMEWIARDALALAERSGDDYALALALMRTGEVAFTQSRFMEAAGYADQSSTIFTRLGKPVEAARTRTCWIVATSSLGRPLDALKAADTAQRVFKAHRETERLAWLQLNASQVCVYHGFLQQAVRRCNATLRLFTLLGASGRRGVGGCYTNRGLAYTRLGRPREALADYERAHAVFKELNSKADLARVTRGIAEARISLGHYSAAIPAFEETLAVLLQVGNAEIAPRIAIDLADCYLRLNRPGDALRALQGAEGEVERLQIPRDAVAFGARRFAAHMQLGQEAQARQALDQVERRFPALAEDHRAWLVLQRASVLQHDGAHSEALAAARQARALAARTGMRALIADASITEGSILLSVGDTGGAARAALRARRLAHAMDAAPLLHRCHELQGTIAETKQRNDVARRHYAAAIAQLEREQLGVIFAYRDSFNIVRGRAYARLAALQLRAGLAAESLATAERAKSRALADAIAGSIALRPRGNAHARRLARDLARAREDYAAAMRPTGPEEAGEAPHRSPAQITELEARIAGLVERHQLAGAAATGDLYGAPPPSDPPEPEPATALLEFFYSDSDVLRFWVDGGGVQGSLLPSAVPAIRRLLQAFRLNLDTAERVPEEQRTTLAEQANQILRRLHDLLLAGLPDAATYESLVIVPHGALHYVPFHALFDGERYLVERVAVSYAPSARLYAVCRSRRFRGGKAVVLAHSAGGRLPFALEEGTAVAAALGTRPREEAAATRAILSAEGSTASVIHLAAHGRFRQDAPLFSAIELADGPLTTADVFDLNLRAGLVALSACETGRAVIGGGDELVGMARAFLYAGAAALLVSQWRVHDRMTATLIERFYAELCRGVGRAEALRRAQIAQLSAAMPESGRVHPFIWAGFQIIGDNQGIVRRPRRAAQGG